MKKLLSFLLGIAAYLVCVFLLTGYGHTETHPALNDVMVLKFLDKLVNADFADPEKFRNYEFNWNNDKQPSLTGPAIKGDFYVSYSAADEEQMNYTPMKWISEGGWMEDEPWGPASLCHFYDPLGIDNGAKYLTDCSGKIESAMAPVKEYLSRDALSWAVSDPNHAYSWKIGKEHVIQALKEPEPSARNNHMAIAFRCLGQVLHLVADMGCTAHVRNDSHPPKFSVVIGDPDPYEDICKKLDVYTLWQANPANPALKEVFNSTASFEVLFDKLARYTNKSYFSGQTIYTDNFKPVVRPDNPYPEPYMTEDHYNKSDYTYYADYDGVRVKMCKDKVPVRFAWLLPGEDSARGRPYLDYDCVQSIASAVFPNIAEAGANIIRMFVPPLKIDITEAKADSGGIIRGKVSYWARSLNDEYSTLFDLNNVYNGAVRIYVNNTDQKIKTEAVKNKFEFKLDGKLAKLDKKDKITVLIDFGGILVKSDPLSLNALAPAISEIIPSRGNPGQDITIRGNNFGGDQSNGEIHFPGVVIYRVDAGKWTDNEVIVTVPDLAVSGPVKIKSGGIFSNEVYFGVPPVIFNLSETSGIIGDLVAINGSKFGESASAGIIEFNGAPVSEILLWNDTRIEVKVPAAATTGKVVVKVKGEASNEVEFQILVPQITNIEPSLAKAGEWVSVQGTGFGNDKSRGEVFFNSIRADEVTDWTNQSIRVRIPAGALSGVVVVRIGAVESNQYYYSVNEMIPVISSVTPEKQQPGQWITINGSNFGHDKTKGIIEFNGWPMEGTKTVSWSDDRISVVVPAEATTGFMYVIIDGVRSNAHYFKVRVFYYQRTQVVTDNQNSYDTPTYKTTSVFGADYAEFSQENISPSADYYGKNKVRGTWEIPPERFYVTDTVKFKLTGSVVYSEGNTGYQVQTLYRLNSKTKDYVSVSSSGTEKSYAECIAKVFKSEFFTTSDPFLVSPITIRISVEPWFIHLGKASVSYIYELREE